MRVVGGALDRTRKSQDVIENIGGHFGSSARLSFAHPPHPDSIVFKLPLLSLGCTGPGEMDTQAIVCFWFKAQKGAFGS